MLIIIPQHPEDHNEVLLNVCLDNWLENPENLIELTSFKNCPLSFQLTLCYPYKVFAAFQKKYHLSMPHIQELNKFWFEKICKRIGYKNTISIFNASKVYSEQAKVVINISLLEQEKIIIKNNRFRSRTMNKLLRMEKNNDNI